MTFVKICGITNLDDALAAVNAGADALGFNFYEPSPRYISPERARPIVAQLPSSVLAVGVFVNQESPEALRKIADAAAVTAVQLHGDETVQYCSELAADYHVIKTFSVTENFDAAMVQAYDVEAVMLDTKHKGLRGGTGRVFDWSIAQQVKPLVKKLYLAGGLSPENIVDAIKQVGPFAVDACSTLETEPGKKDHQRLRAFVMEVRRGEA